MDQKNTHKESERRIATVMFADISGFTAMSEKMDPEQVTGIMNNCFCMIEECITEHAGTIDKFIGDCAMILFGLPVAVEDAPQRAVNAAIEIRNKLEDFNREQHLSIPLNIHIGINTGPVLAGMVGGAEKQEYTVMGDTVNLASRLEDASQAGQILVGHGTYTATRAGFKYKVLDPIVLKGKAEPVPVFELLSIKETLSRVQRDAADRMISSVMIGRDSELNELEFQIMKAINSEGSIVNVIGEAGIGKSRLIAELKDSSVMKKVTLLEGRAISMGTNLGYHLIIDLLKNWTQITEEDSEVAAFTKLESSIRSIYPEALGEILPFLATLMGMKLSGRHAERMKGIEGEALEKLILKNVRDLIIRSTELTPLVIVTEDIHWADISSIEFLESLFRLVETQRVLFINVFRPDYKETGERIVETIKERLPLYYMEIDLEPLTEEMSETLIDNMLNIKGLHHGIKNKIVQRAGGNPFFIEEVVRSFIDEGAVIVKDGGFEVTDKIGTMVIPHTINDVLMARIDRLEDETRNLIKVASVIGRNFFYRVLAEVARSIEDIDNRLMYLEEIQLIHRRKRMEELEYLFKHVLAQEAAYESILIRKRKELHLDVADSIEHIFTERLHEFYGILSYHYIHGDNWDKAEEYMVKAGDEALKSSASNEALHYYQRAIELYIKKHGDDVDKTRIAEIEENIGYALLNKGHFVEAVDYFDRSSINRGEKVQKNKLLILIKAFMSLLSIMRHLYLPGRKKIPTALDDHNINRAIKIGTALIVVDLLRCFLTNLEVLKQSFKYDISRSQASFNGLSAGSTLFSLSGVSFGIARKILEHAQKSIDGRDSRMHLRVYKTSEEVLNFLFGYWQGDIDEDMVDNCLENGDLFFASSYLLTLCYIKIEKGDLKTSGELINRLHSIGEEYDYEHAKSDFYTLNSKLLMKKGELHDAMTFANNGILQVDEAAGDARKVEILGIKSRIEIAQNDLTAAQNTIEEIEAIIDRLGKEAIFSYKYCSYVMAIFSFNLKMIEFSLLSGDGTDIEKYKKKAFKYGKKAVTYARKKVASERTEAYKLLGRYYWLTNKQGKAVKWWDKSIKEGETLGAKVELSRSYFEVGKRLLEPNSKYKELNGIAAQDYLEKARTMFQEMDLQYDMDELEKFELYVGG